MNVLMPRILTAALCVASLPLLLAPGPTGSAYAQPAPKLAESLSGEQGWGITVDAYGYPHALVTMELTRRRVTNIELGEELGGPTNTFANIAAFQTAEDTASRVAQKPLPSWNNGTSKQAIIDFVERVTRPGGPDFVPPAERIATFDNDGTLWAEQPLYFQLLFAIDRIKALAPGHPEWKDKEPYASLLKGDVKAALAGGERTIFAIMTATHAGMTTDEFETIVRDWLATARHPTTGRPYTEMVYQPMLELLAYLRSNGFKTFIVSGGGVEFMRVFAEKVYGIPPEQVIGSSGTQQFEMRDGKPVLVKLAIVDFVNDDADKPVVIQRVIGRRPIAAFGNSDGDLQMLQWTCGASGPRFCLYVHHTDAEREWAYDRGSSIGRLDRGLSMAAAGGWTVVDMKADWKTIFPIKP